MQMMNLNEALSKLAVSSLEVEAANLASEAVVINTSLTCLGIALVTVLDDLRCPSLQRIWEESAHDGSVYLYAQPITAPVRRRASERSPSRRP
jgi:hypothetical protein